MADFLRNALRVPDEPEGRAALVKLIAMGVVLGIDNLIFNRSSRTSRGPHQRVKARRVGISAANVMRQILLATIALFRRLAQPVFTGFRSRSAAMTFGVRRGLKPARRRAVPEPPAAEHGPADRRFSGAVRTAQPGYLTDRRHVAGPGSRQSERKG